jgi:hypothetical protein
MHELKPRKTPIPSSHFQVSATHRSRIYKELIVKIDPEATAQMFRKHTFQVHLPPFTPAGQQLPSCPLTISHIQPSPQVSK